MGQRAGEVDGFIAPDNPMVVYISQECDIILGKRDIARGGNDGRHHGRQPEEHMQSDD